jgi:hypothetical protein
VEPGLLAFDMGAATGYSPQRHGTSAPAGPQASHIPADTEVARDAPHGDAGSRSGEGQAGAVITILGQGGIYGYLRGRVTGLPADPGQSAPRG